MRRKPQPGCQHGRRPGGLFPDRQLLPISARPFCRTTRQHQRRHIGRQQGNVGAHKLPGPAPQRRSRQTTPVRVWRGVAEDQAGEARRSLSFRRGDQGFSFRASATFPDHFKPSDGTRQKEKRQSMFVIPVMFLPGWLRLSTNLLPTGSGTTMKTIGMVFVARCAASAACLVTAIKTSTLICTGSAAKASKRSGCSFGKRCSKIMFRPST